MSEPIIVKPFKLTEEERKHFIIWFKAQRNRFPSEEEIERGQWYPYYDDKPERWVNV